MSVDRYGITVPQELRGVATQPLEVIDHPVSRQERTALADAAAECIARLRLSSRLQSWCGVLTTA